MRLGGARALVTGGAGFIGSNLVDALLAHGARVTVYDDFSTGREDFLAAASASPALTVVRGSVLDWAALVPVLAGHDVVFHLAADPDVRASGVRTESHLEQNVIATARVLEAMLTAGVRAIAFTSTSTVYGEAAAIPTPESYGPPSPISIYGASKLAGEALVSAYCGTHGFRGRSFRFANAVGPRSNHGVTFDFHRKLRADPTRLEILGDGKQSKSYFHVADCVAGMIHAMERMPDASGYDVFNVGSEDAIDVRAVADIVTSEMGLSGVRYEFTGGVDGGRGWKGDVRTMRLDVAKLRSLGWAPRYGSAEAIRDTVRALVREERASRRSPSDADAAVPGRAAPAWRPSGEYGGRVV